MTLHEMQRRLDRFQITEAVTETIEETAGTIEDFNRKQMFEGIRSTGSEIKPAYSPYTVLIKDQKGQPSDRVTLKDTGDFYEGLFVDVNSETFDIYSSDVKTDALVKKYGERIFGLTRESRGEYVQYTFFPGLREKITKKLGFKFG
jgi:hypothetical protein